MTKYLRYSGRHVQYPLSGSRTGFIVQPDKYENFNDATVIANASYLRETPIWGHTELHLTRLWLTYKYNAANTKVAVAVITGPVYNEYIAVPVICCAVSAAGVVERHFYSDEFDIPMDPSGEPGTTSRIQFIIIAVDGVNAADDVTLVFQGWYRDDVPEVEERESIASTDRGLIEAIKDLLS